MTKIRGWLHSRSESRHDGVRQCHRHSIIPMDIQRGYSLQTSWRVRLQSTKAMTFPVLPPTFLRALPRPWAAFEMAGPAVEETRESPSDAFEAAEEAVSPALEAASEVEEAYLTADLRVRNCDCRSTARDAVAGILKTTGGYKTLKGKNDSGKSQVEDRRVQWR